MRSVKQAARSLLRSPVFSLTAVASVGIGVGLACSVFAVVEAALFSPISQDAYSRKPVATAENARLYLEHEVKVLGGSRRLVILAREVSSRRVIGLAETFLMPHTPQVLTTFDVAVAEPWRGHKLSQSLIASLLLEVVSRFPAVHFIRVDMVDSARRFHEQQEEIGFRFRHTVTGWNFPSTAFHLYMQAPS